MTTLQCKTWKNQIEVKDFEISVLNLKLLDKPAENSEESLKTTSFLQKQVNRLTQKKYVRKTVKSMN